MTTDLDARARAAAAGLRRAATELELPAPRPRPRRRRAVRPKAWPAVGVAGAAVAVLIAAVLAVAARSGDDAGRPATSMATGMPVLIPDPTPDGFEPTGATELPRAATDRGPEHLTVMAFGHADAADPAASPDLGISILRAEGIVPGDFGRQVTVRGGPAWVSTDNAGRTALSWEEAPGVLALVDSGTLSEGDLVAVAEGLTFNADHTEVEVPDLPSGLTLLGTMTDAGLTGALAPSVLPDATTGHMVGYQDPADGRALIVATLRIDAGEAAVLHRTLGRPLGDVEVRGHAGRLMVQDADASGGAVLHTLIWEEAPGTYVTVAGNLDEADLLAVAEGLRPASEQEWTDLEALGGEVTPSEPAG